MYEKELENLGLSEKEAKVYVTSLELGPDTVQNLSKHSEINRATTYVQVESLKQKGLMSEFEKGKKTFYIAESPNQLSNLLRAIEKETAIKRSVIEGALPGLMSLFESMGERPKVRFYEGLEGAVAVRNEFLKTKSKMIYGIVDYDKLFHFLPSQQSDYTNERIKKGIKTKTFYVSSKPVDNATSKIELREAKFISSKEMTLDASITLYDDKLAISTFSADPVSVVIENSIIANTCKSIFEYIWKIHK